MEDSVYENQEKKKKKKQQRKKKGERNQINN